MTTLTQRDRQKSGRRSQLLAAAEQLIAERGFLAVRLEDIGAAAGVSGPAIYRHFPNKESLLVELLAEVSARLLEGGQSVVTHAPDAAAALAAAEAADALAREAARSEQMAALARDTREKAEVAEEAAARVAGVEYSRPSSRGSRPTSRGGLGPPSAMTCPAIMTITRSACGCPTYSNSRYWRPVSSAKRAMVASSRAGNRA